MKNLWRLWAKALGQKASDDDKEADLVAIIRTIIALTYIRTYVVIVAEVIRHWKYLALEVSRVSVNLSKSDLEVWDCPDGIVYQDGTKHAFTIL